MQCINGSSPNLAGEIRFNSCWPFEVSMEAWAILPDPKNAQISSHPSLPHTFPASLGSSLICTSMHACARACVRACVPSSSRPAVLPYTLFFLPFLPSFFLSLPLSPPVYTYTCTYCSHSFIDSIVRTKSFGFLSCLILKIQTNAHYWFVSNVMYKYIYIWIKLCPRLF